MKFSWSGLAYAIAITLVIGLGIYTLRGSQGIPALMQKKAEIKDLEKGNEKLAKEIEEQRAKIKRLQENPDAQDLEIRRQLKLVHPGEKVFNSQDQDKKPASQ
jgi:cell division protein FtsB